ncbi:Zinc transporter [Elasticomyces elasticus]|nr:Zinc transporter [Elasticomyces elasticus]KAK3662575.1 Zinc transporter [Elasticomyces elasticus]KAK4927919.1 Zinc transporter [Elasticomyces elasticus]KAK5756060.1 Zinc transporter [Elasticomyces elasticus]
MGLSNDERGWVMTSLSGIACVVGASIICVDIIVRQFPGKKDFRIQDSDTFLSASLSLSFGVMLFSALYSMLPSAKQSLQNGGFSPKQAAWTLIGCFLGGVIGITLLSRVIHHYIPSHIVDCEHTHEGEESPNTDETTSAEHDHAHEPEERPQPRPQRSRMGSNMHRQVSDWRHPSRRTSYFGVKTSSDQEVDSEAAQSGRPNGVSRRPSMQQRLSSTISQITYGKTPSCECGGSCYGYSEPCGQECFKNINARGGHRAPARMGSTRNGSARPPITKSATMQSGLPAATEATPLLQNILEEDQAAASHSTSPTRNTTEEIYMERGPSDASSTTIAQNTDNEADGSALQKSTSNDSNPEHHHHHVPSNAFLSIGLQTSIAIALHKLPEGFITYATNHANPKLGFAVFLALFIHNITEGFAMALPLYLAINNRWKAMLISFVLGGLSQPVGAAVAAVWFKLAGNGSWAPSEGVYGAMFAVTAGIMASVALQLFSESLDLTHSKMLCMVGAFTGMGILGISSALTA